MDKAAGEGNAIRRYGAIREAMGNGNDEDDMGRLDERAGIVDDGYDNGTDRSRRRRTQ